MYLDIHIYLYFLFILSLSIWSYIYTLFQNSSCHKDTGKHHRKALFSGNFLQECILVRPKQYIYCNNFYLISNILYNITQVRR